MAKVKVTPQRGIFLTVGVPKGPRARYWTQRALDALHRAGFQAGLTSDESIKIAAGLIEQDAEERPTTP